MIIEEFRVKTADGRTRLRVKYLCKFCNQQQETSKHYITDDFTYTCRACNNKKSAKNKIGKTTKAKRKSRPNRIGEKSGSWKGGRYINKDGYVMVLTRHGKLSGESGWNKYTKEHKVVIEEEIGRELLGNELIHHIDGEKSNNKLSNLDLLNSHKEHKDCHQSLQELGYQLYKEGKIGYYKETHTYYRKEI